MSQAKELEEALRRENRLQRRQLEIIAAIDAIRDAESEPQAMLDAIVDLLVDQLQAGFCLMFLLDQEIGQATLRAARIRDRQLAPFQHTLVRAFAQQATELPDVTTWQGRDKPPPTSAVDIPADLQLAAVPIIMGANRRLGALLLGRMHRPFGPEDKQLLKTAEDHIDSAVIQGYTYHRHQQTIHEVALKHQELQLIDAIDAIRDSESEPGAMLDAIVRLLAARLQADFCQMFLLDKETGQAALKAAYSQDARLERLQTLITPELAQQAVNLTDVTLWQGLEQIPLAPVADMPADIQLAAVPIVMGEDRRLGALLLGRTRAPFGPDQVQLLRTAEDQIDSAVIQGYLYDEHQRAFQEARLKYQEIDLIAAIDEIRDSVPEPEAMLTSIAGLLAERLKADFCLIFLLDQETRKAELKAFSDRNQQLGRLLPVITRELAQQATDLANVTTWQKHDKASLASADLPEGIQWAAAPIVIGTDRRLGALLLGRTEAPFGPDEAQLLKTAEDQIDSAVVQGSLHRRHQQYITEVETIYQVDQIRDQDLSLDDMLNRVLQVAIDKIDAEMGFVMLYDRAGKQLGQRATTHKDLFQVLSYLEAVDQMVGEALEKGELICHNDLQGALRSAMCLPLILNNQVIGVLGVVNCHSPYGFTSADCRLLKAIGSQIDTAIYERREIRHLRGVLGRSIDPRVMERLLASPDPDILKPERMELTVLYADMRGSTPLAEQTDPELLVEFIKDYLAQMTDVILSHEGTIDKFVGDEVMALFGAPIPQQDHALRAVRAGLEMQAVYQKIMNDWPPRGVAAPPIGIGIVTGKVIVGEMGSPQRSDYTVIGRDVNLGARICGVAQGGQILISEATYHLVQESVQAIPLPGQQFKGVAHDVTVYDVVRLVG